MLEKTVERYLKQQVEKLGGKCYKWVSPGNKGVPDRIAFVRQQIWAIETKSPTGRLSPMQEHVGKEMRKHTLNYIVISTKEEVDQWLKIVTG